VTISISCGCGKTMRVADEHAGKRARCPGCGATLTVPTPQGMTRCFCGHQIEFDRSQVGATTPCPSCSRPVFLTDPSVMTELVVETEAADDHPRCPSCHVAVTTESGGLCPQCGASLRTGKINHRRQLGGRHRLRPPRTGVGHAPVARIASPPPKPVLPPPAALPHIDDSHVEWRDTRLAQRAEDFVEEQSDIGEALDFTPGSLSALDLLLHRSAASDEDVAGAGIYLGEVITRNLGGQWRKAADGRLVIAHLPGGAGFDPVAGARRVAEGKAATSGEVLIELARELGLLG
jgi:hypothetical protein